MPYGIFEQSDEYCVYRIDDAGERMGDALGCHATQDGAAQQIAAVEASEAASKAGRVLSRKNETAIMQALRVIADVLRGAGTEPLLDAVEEDSKEVELESQESVGYVAESPQDPPIACATCKWFIPRNQHDEMPACYLVKSVPEPIMPQGWCNLYTAREGDEYEAPDDEGVIELDAAPAEKKLLGFWPVREPMSYLWKDADGRRYMWQVTSNKYQDRDGEIITEKALREYVDSMWDGDTWRGGQKQVFWHMNPKKYPIGDLVWAGMVKGFLVEVFREENNPLARVVYDAVERNPKGWGSSHGFRYSSKEKDGKVYKRIHKFETTVLPREHAANIFTYARVMKGKENMARSQALVELIKSVHGVTIDNVDELLDSGGFDALDKAIRAAKVPSRDVDATKEIKAEGDAPAPDAAPVDDMAAAMAKLATKLIEDAGAMERAFGEMKASIDELGKRYSKQAEEADAEIKATKEKHASEVAALTDRLKAVEARVNIVPRSAVGNPDSNAIGEALKDKTPGVTELDPMFAELGVKKSRG